MACTCSSYELQYVPRLVPCRRKERCKMQPFAVPFDPRDLEDLAIRFIPRPHCRLSIHYVDLVEDGGFVEWLVRRREAPIPSLCFLDVCFIGDILIKMRITNAVSCWKSAAVAETPGEAAGGARLQGVLRFAQDDSALVIISAPTTASRGSTLAWWSLIRRRLSAGAHSTPWRLFVCRRLRRRGLRRRGR